MWKPRTRLPYPATMTAPPESSAMSPSPMSKFEYVGASVLPLAFGRERPDVWTGIATVTSGCRTLHRFVGAGRSPTVEVNPLAGIPGSGCARPDRARTP